MSASMQHISEQITPESLGWPSPVAGPHVEALHEQRTCGQREDAGQEVGVPVMDREGRIAEVRVQFHPASIGRPETTAVWRVGAELVEAPVAKGIGRALQWAALAATHVEIKSSSGPLLMTSASAAALARLLTKEPVERRTLDEADVDDLLNDASWWQVAQRRSTA